MVTNFIYITLHTKSLKPYGTQPFSIWVLVKIHRIQKGLKTVTLKYLMWMCHIRYSLLTDFIYITLHTQKPKTIWNTAIFHMVFSKNTLNSKGLKNSKATISHVNVPHKILCAY